jgi:hypothetical protein
VNVHGTVSWILLTHPFGSHESKCPEMKKVPVAYVRSRSGNMSAMYAITMGSWGEWLPSLQAGDMPSFTGLAGDMEVTVIAPPPSAPRGCWW